MFTLQINVFKRLVTNSFRFSRFTTTGSLFQLAALERTLGQEKFSYQKEIADPSIKLTLEISPVKNESSLGRFRRLYQEKTTGTWQEWQGEKKEVVVQFTFIPEKKSEEKENTPAKKSGS